MIYGIDYLGGARYPEVIIREHPEGWAAGFFWSVDGFGHAGKIADRLLATGRCPLIRIHLIWSDTHSFSEKDIPTAVKRCKEVRKLSDKYPSIEFRVSPCCEHRMKLPLIRKFQAALKPHMGRMLYVNSPLSQGDVIPDGINEYHGGGKPRRAERHMFSFDGTGCVDVDVEARKKSFKDSEVFFWWTYQMNLNRNANDHLPRSQRMAVPTGKLIDSVIYLKNARGNTSLPKKFLWKSHADQHAVPVPEPRALKPVLICPIQAPFFELVAKNGQVIARSSGSQPYEDGRRRYYFDDFGFHLAEKAIRIQGDPVCKLRANGKWYGTLNPAFRGGEFRG